MAKSSRAVTRVELLQGTLDLMILQTLRWGPRHGYGITQMIQTQSQGMLRVDTGSLYPALHRLEKKGWVSAAWQLSENNQRVREYRLTARGRKQLLAERSKWDRFCEAMDGIMSPPVEVEQ